jgi:hypothetical protein
MADALYSAAVAAVNYDLTGRILVGYANGKFIYEKAEGAQ